MNKQIEQLLKGNNESLQEVGFHQHFAQGGEVAEMLDFILDNYFDKSASGINYWCRENFFCSNFKIYLSDREEYFLDILPRKKDTILAYLILLKNFEK